MSNVKRCNLDESDNRPEGVFSDVKLAAFCWGIAAPLTVKYLADHGAEVVRIESSKHVDVVRLTAPYKDKVPGVNRSLFFANYNNNQYSITLDLKARRGLEVARKIISWADVVIESMLPGAMERLGLSYGDIKKIKPDIVMVSTCNQGQTGPDASRKGYGTQLTAGAGFAHVTGFPDRPPVSPGMMGYTDVCGGRLGATALIAALSYRRRTGKGQYIDLSQFETGVMFLSSQVLDFVANSRNAERIGNRSLRAVPHGAYPCKGQDTWCAISVNSDQDWGNFCEAIGKPEWVEDPRFCTVQARRENEAVLDGLIGKYSVKFSAEELMSRMQSHGISAGVVLSSQGLYEDPQLEHRHHFQTLEHPEIGKIKCDSVAFRLSETPYNLSNPAPCLGEHNYHVCTEILGMSDEDFVELNNSGVLE